MNSHYLVSTAYKIKVMLVQELGDYFCTKSEGDSSVILTPSHSLLVRVWPQKVTKETLIWYICRPHNTSNLLHGLQIWT